MWSRRSVIEQCRSTASAQLYLANYIFQVAQDIIGDLRSLLTEVNYAGTILARAAKDYAEVEGAGGLETDQDSPKRLLRIS